MKTMESSTDLEKTWNEAMKAHTKELKKDPRRREFRKLVRKYKRKLKYIANHADPFDYGFYLEFLVTGLRFMKDYYELGYNVNSEGSEKRLSEIKNALNEYDCYNNADDKFFVFHETGGKENHKGIYSEKNGRSDWWFENKMSFEEISKYSEEHWKEFWKIVSDCMQDWWD